MITIFYVEEALVVENKATWLDKFNDIFTNY